MEVQDTNRIVAIVGRPNVGKSALFNRIVGRRISIVHEQVGVTRDRVSAEAEYNGHRFELIDTGGLGHFDKQVADDEITASTEAQAEIAIADAGLILFVVDITAGLVPLMKKSHDCFTAAVDPSSSSPTKPTTHTAKIKSLILTVLAFPPFQYPPFKTEGLNLY